MDGLPPPFYVESKGMNIIEIEEHKNGFFKAFWRYTSDYKMPNGYTNERHTDRLLFVTGGHVGDFPSASRVEAAVFAERFREKRPEIQDIKFKSMQ